jgi:hypothetical protein
VDETRQQRALAEAIDAWFGLLYRHKSVEAVDLACLRSAPRISVHLPPPGAAVTRELLVEGALNYLGEELERLKACCPDGRRGLSRLEALRLQYLEGKSTKEIVYENPISRSGYFELRASALDLLAEHAMDEAEADPARASDSPPRSRTRRVWPILASSVAGILIVLVIGLRGGGHLLWPGDPLDSVPIERVGSSTLGTEDEAAETLAYLRRERRGVRLPELGTPLSCVAIVDSPVQAKRMMAIGLDKGGPDAGGLVLWDTEREKIVWEIQWQPPTADRLTHSGVLHDHVDKEIYWPRYIVHSSPWGSLGDTLAVVYWSRYSPTFVVYVSLRDGEVEGYYVHPGALYGPLVSDLDGDGTMEVVAGGCDNALGRPDLVVLRVRQGRCAASSVLWNGEGKEGALLRVLPPDDARWCAAMQKDRMRVYDLSSHSWNPTAGRLSCPVGSQGKMVGAYYMMLTLDGRRVEETHLQMADSFRRGWDRAGVDPDAWMAAAAGDIQVLGAWTAP